VARLGFPADHWPAEWRLANRGAPPRLCHSSLAKRRWAWPQAAAAAAAGSASAVSSERPVARSDAEFAAEWPAVLPVQRPAVAEFAAAAVPDAELRLLAHSEQLDQPY